MRQRAAGQGLHLDVAQIHAAVAERHGHERACGHHVAGGDFAGHGNRRALGRKVQQRLAVIALQGRRQHQSLAAAGCIQQLAYGRAGWCQCQRITHQPGQCHAALLRQFMAGCHQRQHGRGYAAGDGDAGLGGPAETQAYVGRAGTHGTGNLVRGKHRHFEDDAAVLALEGRAQARQEFTGEGIGAGDAHLAAAQALQGLDLVERALGVQPCSARMIGQDLAGGVEHHAARAALEQRRAQPLLQCRNLAADGRGCHMQSCRSLAQRSALRDFVEVAQRGVLQQQMAGLGHGRRWRQSAIVPGLLFWQRWLANLPIAANAPVF